MQLLTRSAIVVRAKGRYVEWANSVREDGPKFTIEEARTNPGVYLVFPVVEDEEAPSDKDLLDARATELFEAELARWTDDEEKWPDTRTPHAFRAWFDVEVIGAVADMDEEAPIAPLSEDEAVEAALEHCAWCGGHLEDNEVRLVPYEPAEDEDVDPEARALPVTIGDDEEHVAIAVRAGEFELADVGGDEDEDEEDDDESPAPRRRRDEDAADEDEEDDEDYDEDEDDDEEEEGWVLACCSEKCREELEEALTASAEQ
jgi:hypothetical protein